MVRVSNIKSGKGDIQKINALFRGSYYPMEQAEEHSNTPLYHNLLETMQDGVVIISPAMEILYANKAFCKMMKSSPVRVCGNSLTSYIHNSSLRKIRTMIKPERKVKRGEVCMKTSRSTLLPAYASVTTDNTEADSDICIVFKDLATDKLTDKKKYEFIDIASHELKTPLTNVVAFTQLLNKYFSDHQDAQANDYLLRMKRQLNRLTSLVSSLLDVSQVEEGKMSFEYKSVDVDGLLNEIATETTMLSPRHPVIHEGRSGSAIRGDRERLGQVIRNVIHNAVKYSPPDKNIMLRAARKGKNVIIEVEDFGIGIPVGQLKKVFRRFYRVRGTGRESYPGLGLGLYISSEIINRHKGKIWVKSEEGSGSTFYISLPVAKT